MPTTTFTSPIPCSPPTLYQWHQAPGAFERLNPPWEPVRLHGSHPGLSNGSQVTVLVPLGPFFIPWKLTHTGVQPDVGFQDIQVSGPFASWHHTHAFHPRGEQQCTLDDSITFQLPLAPLTSWLGDRIVLSQLRRLFAYRHATTQCDIERWQMIQRTSTTPTQPQGTVVITGATGLVGSSLAAFLSTGGFRVHALCRDPKTIVHGATTFHWDFKSEALPFEAFKDCVAVIHLAGENIAAKRWSTTRKQELSESRVSPTHLLSSFLSTLPEKPKVFICASAVGAYGNTVKSVDESAPFGSGFLADLTRSWEAATAPASAANIRTVNARFGVILSPRGGALKKMLLPFRLGLGGKLGDGKQLMSWISLDDTLYALLAIISSPSISGPVNITAPAPVSNAEFSKTLARVLSRPALFPVPAAILRCAFGEMADEALLASQSVIPRKLTEQGFQWSYPELERALRHVLGR